MTRQVITEFVGDSSKFSKATQEAITKSETLGGKLQGIGKGMVIGAGIGAFNLLTTAVGTAVGKLDEAHQAFLADEASQALLSQALTNSIPGWDGSTAAVEGYASAQAALGFADDDVRASIGQLVGITHDQTEAMKLNSLAQDLARAKGIDLATATDIVTKAAQGNGKALKSLGVDTTGAKDAAGLLDAIQKNVKGSAEAWAATNTGKLAVSNVKVGEAMEKVGAVVDQVSQVAIPILADALTEAISLFSGLWKGIQPVISTLANALMPIFRTVVGYISGTIVPAINAVAKVVMPALSVAAKVMGDILGTVFGVIGTAIGVLVNVWKTAFGIIGGVIGILQGVLSTLAGAVGRVFGGISGIVRSAFNAVIGAVNGIIRAINSLSVHVSIPNPFGGTIASVDWNGPNLGYLPYLHRGGIVPGPPGADVLTMLQAGERVSPAGAGSGVTIIVEGNVYGDAGISDLADQIARHLRLIGATS